MIPRRQFGQMNYSEAGIEDVYAGDEEAQRAAAPSFNTGQVYQNSTRQVGGVRPGVNGMLPTRNQFYGVLGATLAPIGLTAGQTYLSQNAANAVGWAGDTPVDLMPTVTRAAPWRRSTLAPVKVY